MMRVREKIRMKDPIDFSKIFKLWTWREDFTLVEVEVWKIRASPMAAQDVINFWIPSLGVAGSLGSKLFNLQSEAYFAAANVLKNSQHRLVQKFVNLERSF